VINRPLLFLFLFLQIIITQGGTLCWNHNSSNEERIHVLILNLLVIRVLMVFQGLGVPHVLGVIRALEAIHD